MINVTLLETHNHQKTCRFFFFQVSLELSPKRTKLIARVSFFFIKAPQMICGLDLKKKKKAKACTQTMQQNRWKGAMKD